MADSIDDGVLDLSIKKRVATVADGVESCDPSTKTAASHSQTDIHGSEAAASVVTPVNLATTQRRTGRSQAARIELRANFLRHIATCEGQTQSQESKDDMARLRGLLDGFFGEEPQQQQQQQQQEKERVQECSPSSSMIHDGDDNGADDDLLKRAMQTSFLERVIGSGNEASPVLVKQSGHTGGESDALGQKPTQLHQPGSSSSSKQEEAVVGSPFIPLPGSPFSPRRQRRAATCTPSPPVNNVLVVDNEAAAVDSSTFEPRLQDLSQQLRGIASESQQRQSRVYVVEQQQQQQQQQQLEARATQQRARKRSAQPYYEQQQRGRNSKTADISHRRNANAASSKAHTGRVDSSKVVASAVPPLSLQSSGPKETGQSSSTSANISSSSTATPSNVLVDERTVVIDQAELAELRMPRLNIRHHCLHIPYNKTHITAANIVCLPANAHRKAIIFTLTRNDVQIINGLLFGRDVSCDYYDGSLTAGQREKSQENWMGKKARVMTATQEFPFGIDNLECDLIVCASLPMSLVGYIQQAGMAGRARGSVADAYLLFSPQDYPRAFQLLNHSVNGSKGSLDEAVAYALNRTTCRIQQIHQLLDPTATNWLVCRDDVLCDNCQREADEWAAAAEAIEMREAGLAPTPPPRVSPGVLAPPLVHATAQSRENLRRWVVCVDEVKMIMDQVKKSRREDGTPMTFFQMAKECHRLRQADITKTQNQSGNKVAAVILHIATYHCIIIHMLVRDYLCLKVERSTRYPHPRLALGPRAHLSHELREVQTWITDVVEYTL